MTSAGDHGNGTGIGKSSADRLSDGPLQRLPACKYLAKSVLELRIELSKKTGHSSKVRGAIAAPPDPTCDRRGLCLCRLSRTWEELPLELHAV